MLLSLKMRNFCYSEGTIKRMKRQVMEEERIFVTYKLIEKLTRNQDI